MMPGELAQVLALGEGQSVEFKVKADAKTVGRHVCAFLNSGGGYIVLGAGTNGVPIGVKAGADQTPCMSWNSK
jgi:ATP-dependent DNA helicase RecG